MLSKYLVIKDLYELYEIMKLPRESVDVSSGFTIHYLQDIFKELPFTSIAYRPNYFTFSFIRDGVGKYIIDGQEFIIEPGMVYFTNPGHYRTFEWNAITDICHITFTESYLKEYIDANVYDEFSFLLAEVIQPGILKPHEFDIIEQLYQHIYREYAANSPYKNRLIGNLMVILLLKIKEYFFQNCNPVCDGNRSAQIVKAFKRNLEQHFRELVNGIANQQLRVQDYADRQFLNVNYLSHVISCNTGKSIRTWIADKTIAEAKVMLQSAELSVKEIALRLGFLEVPHFSNYFKKHTFLSPVEYRKKHFK
ncbi:MAG TPA: AraC family transcriptional regulator [Arachidicoccus sp.]